MSFMTLIDVLSRWLHVIAACLAIGGAFFLRFLLPMGIAPLDPQEREATFLRSRRAFKLTVHPAILVLLVTGTYNYVRNRDKYRLAQSLDLLPVAHGFFGLHLLLGLAVIGISLWLLARREPVRSHRSWMRANIVLMLLTVAAASSLKWVRDYVVFHAPRPAGVSEVPVRPLPLPLPPATPPTTAGANIPS